MRPPVARDGDPPLRREAARLAAVADAGGRSLEVGLGDGFLAMLDEDLLSLEGCLVAEAQAVFGERRQLGACARAGGTEDELRVAPILAGLLPDRGEAGPRDLVSPSLAAWEGRQEPAGDDRGDAQKSRARIPRDAHVEVGDVAEASLAALGEETGEPARLPLSPQKARPRRRDLLVEASELLLEGRKPLLPQTSLASRGTA